MHFIAHRGAPALAPENTIPSLRKAVDLGARFIETDVQLTRDGVPVLFHDRTLERLCGRAGAIGDFNFHDVKLFRVRSLDVAQGGEAGAPIPKLDALVELLCAHPRVTAFIELKRISLSSHTSSFVLDTVLRSLAPVRSQCVLISFATEVLHEAKARGVERLGAVLTTWEQRESARLRALEPEFVFCEVDLIPQGYVHCERIPKLALYDINDFDQARALAARGFEYIETSRIAEQLVRARQIEQQDA